MEKIKHTDMRLNDSVPDSVVITYLSKENKRLSEELGKAESYIEELEDCLKKECNGPQGIAFREDVKAKVIREGLYLDLKHKVLLLEKETHELRKLRDSLLSKLNNR